MNVSRGPRTVSQKYRDNYGDIFGKKNTSDEEAKEELTPEKTETNNNGDK